MESGRRCFNKCVQKEVKRKRKVYREKKLTCWKIGVAWFTLFFFKQAVPWWWVNNFPMPFIPNYMIRSFAKMLFIVKWEGWVNLTDPESLTMSWAPGQLVGAVSSSNWGTDVERFTLLKSPVFNFPLKTLNKKIYYIKWIRKFV